MRLTILLCDKKWTIQKILLESSGLSFHPKNCLTDLLENPEELTANGSISFQKYTLALLEFSDIHSRIPAIICTFSNHFLVFLTRLWSEQDFKNFSDILTQTLDWAEKNLTPLYLGESLQIQQISNQLINSRKALVKSNQQLKQLLDEVREANSIIALLERDTLTNLYCASAFYRKVQTILSKNKTTSFDIMVLDISHFNLINEIFGHSSGDRLLQDLAVFLTGLDPENQGIFARDFADIFYILMPSQFRFYETLSHRISGFLQNYPLSVRVSANIGVYPVSVMDTEISVEQMCDRARIALHSVFAQPGSNIGFYSQALHKKLVFEHQLYDSVQKALEQREFQLYLQPKVNLLSGEIIGAEALIRWFHPEFGLISPDQFIPLLEQSGDIYLVDQFIWEETCKVLQKRRKQGLRSLPISVNVSRMDLYQDDLSQVLKKLLTTYQLKAKELRLEVLERAYVHDSKNIFLVLSELRKEGFFIEMDDFGTGESSLAMLADMPVDCLKLDRRFLTSALSSARHCQIIRFIIQLAQALDLHIIAEGVETLEQAKLLVSMDCHYAQGYYYGRPEPAERFLAMP